MSYYAASKTGDAFPAVITKIDRVKTGQRESMFVKVDAGCETVRVIGRPEELTERLKRTVTTF